MVAALAHTAGCVDRDNEPWHLLVARIPDGEHLSRPQAIAAVGSIASAAGVPVTADIEAGYGPAPADVAETVATVIDAERRE
jgi:2-methylisocitrate lyase-like PEP mutase family enzyme